MSAEQFTSGVSLADLYARRDFAHATDVVVSSCCKDHTRCRPGDLYVALLEADSDGHEFAQAAVDRGAKAILTERLLPLQIPQCIVRIHELRLASCANNSLVRQGRTFP